MKPNFENSLRKAKIKNTLRIILITVITILIIIPIFYFFSNKIVAKNSNELNESIFLRNLVAEPNIQIDSSVLAYSTSTGGNITTNRSKNISGYTVPWDTINSSYSLLGYHMDYNEFSPGQHMTENNIYSYNKQTKQKVADFYHPELNYSKYLKTMPNDLNKMNSTKDELAEVAISFDKPIRWSEFQDYIPKEVTVKWLYMTSNTETKEITGPTGLDVYGYHFDKDNKQDTFEQFLDDLSVYDNQNKDSDIQKFLKQYKDSDFLDVPILGVLVTGENKYLKKLENIPNLRASSIGVVVEKTPYINVE
ncbi:sigma factor regulator N-terminal domain-containing protein [Vagococcus fluvialis]|uniref:sigma factor regulator N-terminal domain-containing protein n=1 Tax=Vagococcus fluvialis TaxID=2738 RepID=UPI003B5BAB69